MSEVEKLISEVLALDKKATKGPWFEREDTDYYQAGTYLGGGGYRYGARVDGTRGKIQVDERIERPEYFECDVCRIESGEEDKRLIQHYRTAAPTLAKMLQKAIETLNNINEENEQESTRIYLEKGFAELDAIAKGGGG